MSQQNPVQKEYSSLSEIVEELASKSKELKHSAAVEAWTFTDKEIERARAGELMLNPSVDFSNGCNLNCPYCFIESITSVRKKRLPNELTLSETLGIITDFAMAGARTVNIVGSGEPTVDPHFEELIAFISSLGLRTVLFTNGIRFTERPSLAEWLYLRNVSIVLKFNSTNHALQDSLVGLNGYAPKRDACLRILVQAGFAECQPTRLGFDILALSSVISELPEIYRACRRLNIVPLIADFIPTGRTQGGSFNSALFPDSQKSLLGPLDNAQRSWLSKELMLIDRELGIRRENGVCSYYGGGKCTQILGVYVDILGRIWPCVAREQITGGAISREPLGSIRNGEQPSSCWHEHPYMNYIRAQYTGGCPYKKSIQ